MHRFLPPRERVAELARRGQRGGPGRQYPESRIGIGRDLQQAAGIVQAVHLVENEHRSGRPTVEVQFRIGEHPSDGGEIAIQIHRIRQHARESGLADTPPRGSALSSSHVRTFGMTVDQHHGGVLAPRRGDAAWRCANRGWRGTRNAGATGGSGWPSITTCRASRAPPPHVAAATSTIRVGAGGIMLPNHAAVAARSRDPGSGAVLLGGGSARRCPHRRGELPYAFAHFAPAPRGLSVADALRETVRCAGLNVFAHRRGGAPPRTPAVDQPAPRQARKAGDRPTHRRLTRREVMSGNRSPDEPSGNRSPDEPAGGYSCSRCRPRSGRPGCTPSTSAPSRTTNVPPTSTCSMPAEYWSGAS